MSWYNEAIFYHIYPLGLTGAPKHNDYSAPVYPSEHITSMDRPHQRNRNVTALYIGLYSKV